MKVSQKVKEYVGTINRGNVQRAIQSCLLQQDVDSTLFRQLASLDVALEVEQTALLHIDDRARNFNNPARLAATYTSVRELLKADEHEKRHVDDGWDNLLIDSGGSEPGKVEPQLQAVLGVDYAATPSGYGKGSSGGEVEGSRLDLTTTPTPKRYRLDTLTRRRIEIALRSPRPNKAEIARQIGVSRSTVDRINRQLETD